MKLILIAMSIAFSFSAFAKTPATEAVKSLITSGEYEGVNGKEKCVVTVNIHEESVTVSLTNKNSYDVFALLNSSARYSVDSVTGEISANQSLNFPHYLRGGTKLLNIVSVDSSKVEFNISNILLDHKGNDASTYSSCTVSL